MRRKQHRIVVCKMDLIVQKKAEKVKPKIRWWKLKETSCQEAFRQEVTKILGDENGLTALRMLMEKYREGQRELHCVFVDLEKAYDRVPREELCYCMKKSGMMQKYVQLVQVCTKEAKQW